MFLAGFHSTRQENDFKGGFIVTISNFFKRTAAALFAAAMVIYPCGQQADAASMGLRYSLSNSQPTMGDDDFVKTMHYIDQECFDEQLFSTDTTFYVKYSGIKDGGTAPSGAKIYVVPWGYIEQRDGAWDNDYWSLALYQEDATHWQYTIVQDYADYKSNAFGDFYWYRGDADVLITEYNPYRTDQASKFYTVGTSNFSGEVIRALQAYLNGTTLEFFDEGIMLRDYPREAYMHY